MVFVFSCWFWSGVFLLFLIIIIIIITVCVCEPNRIFLISSPQLPLPFALAASGAAQQLALGQSLPSSPGSSRLWGRTGEVSGSSVPYTWVLSSR